MKAIVFPGQGSQYVGMGKDFYETFSESKEVFHEVDDALGPFRIMFDNLNPKASSTS